MEIDNEILAALASGNVVGIREPGTAAEKQIQTQISHVFLYPSTAYKLYRKDNTGFNQAFRDLSDPTVREQFISDDFFWNRYFNSSVYTHLHGIRVENRTVRLVRPEEPHEDLVIEMRRIDASDDLTQNLISDRLSPANLKNIGYGMTKLIAEFPHKPSLGQSFYSLMASRLVDIRNFAYMADPFISRQEADEVVDTLEKHLATRREEYEALGDEQMTIAIDCRSDNVLYANGQVSFIDIYQVKESWLLVNPLLNIYRLASHAYVLGGKELGDAMVEGYQAYYGLANMDPGVANFFLTYGALIEAALLYNIAKENGQRIEEAGQYWEYVKNYNKKLSAIVI